MSVDEALNPQDPQDSSYSLSPVGSVANQPIEGGLIDRTLPRQIAAGTQRGILTIFGSINIANTSTGKIAISIDGSSQSISVYNPTTNKVNISLDGSGQALIVTNSDGSKVGLGKIPNSTTEFGFFSQDTSGNLIMKIINGTWYVYDITTTKNAMQSGKLPDNSYGWAVAASGKNVSDGIS